MLISFVFSVLSGSQNSFATPPDVHPAIFDSECERLLGDLARVRSLARLEADEMTAEPHYQDLLKLKDDRLVYGAHYDLTKMTMAMYVHEPVLRYVRGIQHLSAFVATLPPGEASRARRSTVKIRQIGEDITKSLAEELHATEAITSVLSLFAAVLSDPAILSDTRFMTDLDEVLLDPRVIEAEPLAVINADILHRHLLKRSTETSGAADRARAHTLLRALNDH